MKKFLLSLAAVAAMAVSANATQVTFDFTKNSYGLPAYDAEAKNAEYVETPATVSLDGATIILDQAGQSSGWRMWSDGLRAYNKQSPFFTVTAGGEDITYVSWTTASGATFALDGTTENITEWQGTPTDELTFNYTNTSSNLAVKTITVVYGEAPDIEKPEVPEVNVAQAIDLINGGYEGEAIISGIVSEVGYFNSTYGSLTYYISDNGETTGHLQVYGGLGLNGAKFAGKEDVAVGAKVTVKGSVKLYNGAPEVDVNSIMLSYEAPEGGDTPVDPEPGDEPTEPTEPTGDNVTFDFTNPAGLNPAQEPESDESDTILISGVTFTEGVISVTTECPEGTAQGSLPRLFKSANGWDFRFYKDSEVTIAAEEGYVITYIVFTSSNNNLSNGSIVWTGNGSYADKQWTSAEGGADKVEITKTATGSNPNIQTMTVYYAEVEDDAVEAIVADQDAPVVYYNLQGVRVAEPANGLYIRVQGSKITKEVVR